MSGKVKKELLYAFDVRELEYSDLFHLAYERLPQERRNKTDKYHQARDRRLCVGAGVLLAKALADAGRQGCSLQCDTKAGSALYFGAQGKPYLNDGSGLFFNLSHSDDYVLCAVAQREVGCDVERVKDVDIALANRFFCEEEYAHIAAQETAEEQIHLFFRYWTLKESFMKATGLGMSLPLHSFRIKLEGEKPALVQMTSRREYFLREYDDIPGYCCAVCLEGAEFRAHLQMLTAQELLS